MNNDQFDRDNKNTDKLDTIKNQQFIPGGFPGQQPDFRGPFRRPPQGSPQRPPQGPPQRPPQGPPQRPPQRPPQGPPQRPPQGPPQRPPQGPPQRPPQGPPQGPPQRPPQGPPGGPPRGPQQGPPTSAPPNFTPELPRMEGQPFDGGQTFTGPGDFSAQRGLGGFIFVRPWNFRGCMNRFTYIWLINGNNFWFYPIFVGRNTVEGFRWRRNRWEFDRIFLNRVLFFRCF